MGLRQAKEIMNNFYDTAVYRIEKRNRDLYLDGIFDEFSHKSDAIITACIYTNKSDNVWRNAQTYKFELESKLRGVWDAR